MTLFPGMKMILRQKSRCFLTSNSQFAFLTDLPAYEQFGLYLIIPKLFWFLKISNNFSLQRLWIRYVDFRYSKVRAILFFLFFFFGNASLSHYTVVHIIVSSVFLVRRWSHIWFLTLIIYQLLINNSFSIVLLPFLHCYSLIQLAKSLVILWHSSYNLYLIGLLTFIGKGSNICQATTLSYAMYRSSWILLAAQ